MKKINLIEWLSRNSHEKQSPQRFARYAAMLIMLLTLGVGQMWGASVSTGQMFFADINNCGNFAKDDIKVLFKFWNGESATEVQGTSAGQNLWYCTVPAGANGATKVSLQRCNSDFSGKWNETSKFNIESGKDVVQPSESEWSWTSATMYASTTIYATPSTMSLSQWGSGKNFRANVKIGDDNYIQFRMSSTGKNYNGEPIYKCQYFSTWGGWHLIQFQVYDGDSWKEQKEYDKTTAGWDYAGAKTNSANKIFNGSSWVAYNYDVTITFNMKGHGSAPSNITLLKGGTASAPSDPSASGYDFGGWYTDSECTSAWSWSTAVNEDKILYAKWTESALPSVSLDATKTTGINVGETITITATAHNTSATNYDFKEGSTSKQNSASATFSYTPTTVGNKTISVVMTYAGGTKEASIDLTLNTPSVALAVKAGSSNEIYLGETTTTMKATPSNVGAGVTPSYTFTDQAASPVSSGAQTSTEWTYTPGVTGTKTMKVTMSVGGATYTATKTVKVYEHWNIYVHDVANWGSMYLYLYDNSNSTYATLWPGTACTTHNGSSTWYKVTLDSKWPHFILNNNNNKQLTPRGGISVDKSTYTPDSYWYTDFSYTGTYGDDNGKDIYTLASISVTDPTVTLSASVANCKDITLNGNVTNFGGDGTKASEMKEVYFQVGGTKKSAGTISSSNGNFSKTISSASAGATNTLQAFATNIHGTGSSSTLHYTNVTLNPQGGADGTTSVTAVENTAMPAGATAPTRSGYTFGGYYASAGGEGKQYYTNTMTSANTWDQTTKDATIHAKWTANPYTITLNKHNGESNGSVNVTFDANTGLTSNVSVPVRTGYTFGGYYTEESGAGIQLTNASGAWQTGNAWIDASGNWVNEGNVTLHAKWTINNHAINYTAPSHGSYTIKVGTAEAVSENTTSDYNQTVTLAANPATGYHFVSWSVTKTADASTVTVTSNQFTMPDYPVTVSATFAANTYSVTFDANGGTGDAMGPQAFTYDVALALSTNTYTRTGYDFDGWATTADGAKVYDPAESVNNLTATNGGTFPLFAHWTAKSYTVTLDKQTDVTGYGGTEGTVANQTVTFDATPATVSGTMPSAANGYCFMGFYSATGGNGRCFIDPSGNWVTSAGDTISGGNWVKPAGITLYAYYKKAEITEVTLSTGSTVAPSTTGITATATLAPTPAGTTHIDWRILYSNDNPLATQPNFGTGTTTNSFTAPETSGTYKLEATLRTGNTPNSGTVLDSYVLAFQVAGDHTVTVQYKCGDEVIRASASVTGKPLASTEITAPDIVGYTFSKWKAGDGITIDGADGNGEKASATINFTAIYDGKLTAIYTKKQMIYFNNTLGWEDVWVYFYNDASGNKYWANNYGTGANKQQPFNNNHPYWEQEHGQMTQIEGTDIWYFDFQSEDWYSTTRTKVAFVNKDQSIDISGASNDEAFFHNASVIYREDFDATNLPMFVPIDAVEYDYTINTGSKYYRGYWMNYPESTGYTLKIYNKKTNDGSDPAEIRSIPFEFTADKTMPMELDVDLEAGKTYGFKIYCNNDTWLGNNGTMTATTPNWDLSTGTSNCGLTTTAAGNYKFTLNYFAVSSTDYKLRIGVTYPVAAGDYQVLYKDDTMSKWFISAVVPAASDKDTVSFFVRKNENPVLKLQKCSSVGTGTVTWSDTVANLISVLPSAITQDSVYIFCLNKNAEGKRALGDVKAYTGNYYIRTDCAGTTKWDNYRAADHLMTYSEYSETYSDFTHYFVAHVESGNNVKFVVANDYSPNISDTLEISTYRGGDGDHIEEGGNIKANANVRFMWDRRKNAVYRAYLDEAKSDGSRFLVLRANSSEDLMDENGNPLTSGNNHGAPDNSIQFVDNENWIYETNVMVKPSAYVKLYGHFHGQDFYFKGESGDDFNGEDGDSDGIANAIQLMTGTGGAQKVRVIYDFKTDRLLAAWMPSGEIDGEHKINADVMFVREGQGDIAQLVFVDEDLDGKYGSITAIKSAYGVMRFNKWTLNNKDKDTHTVLSSPASIYERSLFWISFPFRVKLSEVFGFGTYGVDWAIQRYDGAERAEKGFWAESSGFWKWMDRNTEYLEPDQGYLLAIDLDLLGESASVWNNGVEQIELYFPSYGTMPNITNANVEHALPSHACTIDWSGRSNGNGGTLGSAYNRTVIDSHWNVMSVPTYVNTSNIDFANTTWTNTIGPNFLYTWNASDNTLTPTAGAGYHYHAMHAYMVQYHEGVTWTASSGSPYSSIVARRTYAEQPKKVNFCLEIQQNEKMIDRTFVQLSDDEEVSAEFNFGEDMGKEFNSRKANIYTVIEGYLQAAGNTLPMSDQTTLVPVGVKTTAAGEYTFAMPEGTNGVSVVLIDNIAGTRTNLALSDYTVALGKGDLSDRFMLEIAPIKQMPTDIENIQGGDVQGTKVRKVMVDGILYIVKDGKVFDARGAKVK